MYVDRAEERGIQQRQSPSIQIMELMQEIAVRKIPVFVYASEEHLFELRTFTKNFILTLCQNIP